MTYQTMSVPEMGEKISIVAGKLSVPDHPILPYVEGDGTGRDIWRASQKVFDAAVGHAYGDKRKIKWMEVFAGEKAYNKVGSWLPDETVQAFKDFLVGIKGPLTTPIGGGFRSLNVAFVSPLTCTSASARYATLMVCLLRSSTLNSSIWSFSARTPRTSTPGLSSNMAPKQQTVHGHVKKYFSQPNMKRSVSLKLPALALSLFPKKARSVWCAPPSSGRWTINATRSPWCTKAIS